MSSCGGSRPEPRPNLILVTFDTTRADHLSAYGYRDARTRVLDRLADEGTLFETAIAHVPLTAPSMASLMTSTYPFVNGVRTTGFERLPLPARTLAEVLKDRGYHTAAFIGSFSLDSVYGLDQGFDLYDDDSMTRPLAMAAATPAPVAVGATPDLSTWDHARDFLTRRAYTDAERPAEQVTRSVLSWLDRRRGDPFFLWVHYFDPHTPHRAPKAFLDAATAGRRSLGGPNQSAGQARFCLGYDAELLYTDADLGKLLDGVRARGLLDRSLLVVHGDHGEEIGNRHGYAGHGLNLFDDTMRVPLLVRGLGWPAGRRIRQPVRLLDVAPTILDSLRVAVDPEFRGRSLLPLLEGRSREAEPAYIETHFALQFPRASKATRDAPAAVWKRGLRSGRFKLVLTYAGTPYDAAPRPSLPPGGDDDNPGVPVGTELYDLQEDPGEQRNVAAAHPDVIVRMQSEIASLIRDAKRARADRVRLSDEDREKLRSLGYVE